MISGSMISQYKYNSSLGNFIKWRSDWWLATPDINVTFERNKNSVKISTLFLRNDVNEEWCNSAKRRNF